MSILQFRPADYRFRPTWLGTLITVLAIPVFIKLGLWQYHKAEQKQTLQAQYEKYEHAAAVPMPAEMDDPVAWRYRRVQLTGVYDASHQILLDNQVHADQAGYHVLTPLLVDGNQLVLVNRGWIAGSADHKQQPRAEVPAGTQTITGRVWLPPSKFYSLETAAPAAGQPSWPVVWQNLDMTRYADAVNQPLVPVVIRLDREMPGGYVRDWPRPAERIGTHIGYAYQWFGFAVATLFIYLFVSFRKKPD